MLDEQIIRMGMVGGGPGSLIGPVHRMAAELDGRIRLVAGVFSRDPEASRAAGRRYGVAPDRIYPDYDAMFRVEAGRDDGIDFVSIVTPNATHLPIARAALAADVHVLSDKPPTATLAEAVELAELVAASGRHYALSFTYTGYPMVREARALVQRGALGTVRKLVVEYLQGWMADPAALAGNRQAEWRLDPAQAGIGGCIADIGVHAFNLAEFASGQAVTHVDARLSSLVPGRLLDDDCTVTLRLANGAPGLILASQVATGERNDLNLRIWGDKAGLRWSHERPEELVLTRADGTTETRHAGGEGLGVSSRAAKRLPTGHPEGFIEAMANIYGDFADALIRPDCGPSALQGIAEGVRSMQFISSAIACSAARDSWMPIGEAAFQ